jgi:hypothetical protein
MLNIMITKLNAEASASKGTLLGGSAALTLRAAAVRSGTAIPYAAASERARWVCAADKIHNGRSILADLRRTMDPDTVWSRFRVGREGTIQWYRQVHDRLAEIGFDAPIMAELRAVADELSAYSQPNPALR